MTQADRQSDVERSDSLEIQRLYTEYQGLVGKYYPMQNELEHKKSSMIRKDREEMERRLTAMASRIEELVTKVEELISKKKE